MGSSLKWDLTPHNPPTLLLSSYTTLRIINEGGEGIAEAKILGVHLV